MKGDYINHTPLWYPDKWAADKIPTWDLKQLARGVSLARHENKLTMDPRLALAIALREGRRDYGMTDRWKHPDRTRFLLDPVNTLATKYNLPLTTDKIYNLPQGVWNEMVRNPYHLSSSIAPKASDGLMAILYMQHKLGKEGTQLPSRKNLSRWTGGGPAATEAAAKTKLIEKYLSNPKNQEIRNMFDVYANDLATRKPWLYPVRGGAR